MTTSLSPSRVGSLRSSCSGTAVIEFALMLPIVFLLVAGLADLGVGFWNYMQVKAAADAGAQYAAGYTFDVQAIEDTVQSYEGTQAINANPAPLKVYGCAGDGVNSDGILDGSLKEPVPQGTVCGSGAKAGLYAKVSAQMSYSPIVPFWDLPPTMTLTRIAYRRLD